MQKLTHYTNKNSVADRQQWFIVDAEGVRLGRLASKVASLLIGKDQADNVAYDPNHNHVIVLNSDKVDYHASKADTKFYYRHSGYPGALKSISLQDQMAKDSRKVVEKAIAGMLPKSKQQDKFLGRLEINKNANHNHEAQKPQQINIEIKAD